MRGLLELLLQSRGGVHWIKVGQDDSYTHGKFLKAYYSISKNCSERRHPLSTRDRPHWQGWSKDLEPRRKAIKDPHVALESNFP
jgi:hypothetical protein